MQDIERLDPPPALRHRHAAAKGSITTQSVIDDCDDEPVGERPPEWLELVSLLPRRRAQLVLSLKIGPSVRRSSLDSYFFFPHIQHCDFEPISCIQLCGLFHACLASLGNSGKPTALRPKSHISLTYGPLRLNMTLSSTLTIGGIGSSSFFSCPSTLPWLRILGLSMVSCPGRSRLNTIAPADMYDVVFWQLDTPQSQPFVGNATVLTAESINNNAELTYEESFQGVNVILAVSRLMLLVEYLRGGRGFPLP